MITQLRKRFAPLPSGEFYLRPATRITDVLKERDVPNSYGIYLIYGNLEHSGRPIYIGKAGTVLTDGTWRKQGLRRRLSARQEKLPRNEFFARLIDDKKLSGLSFAWFVTFKDGQGTIPSLIEAELIQKHLDRFRCLPMLNKDF